MSDTPDVPPWEPIADWLCRIEDTDHGTASTQERRKKHEQAAKAIAYDIATHGTERIDPVQMQADLMNDTPADRGL